MISKKILGQLTSGFLYVNCSMAALHAAPFANAGDGYNGSCSKFKNLFSFIQHGPNCDRGYANKGFSCAPTKLDESFRCTSLTSRVYNACVARNLTGYSNGEMCFMVCGLENDTYDPDLDISKWWWCDGELPSNGMNAEK